MKMKLEVISVKAGVTFDLGFKGEWHNIHGKEVFLGDRPPHQVFILTVRYILCSERIYDYLKSKNQLKRHTKTKTFTSFKLDSSMCFGWLSNEEYWKAWKVYKDVVSKNLNILQQRLYGNL